MIRKKNTKWLVFLVGMLFLFLPGIRQVQAAGAKLYFSPASSKVEVGQTSSVNTMGI